MRPCSHWREDPICGCGWHIPGGIIRFKESIGERLQKTAQIELGTEILFNLEPMAINEIILTQTVRGHFISLLYHCFLPENFPCIPVADPEKPYRAGDICWHSACPRQWVMGQENIYRSLFRLPAQSGYLAPVSAAEKLKAGTCTVVFDIDGVIAAFDSSLQYDQAKPAQNVIEIVNWLYDCGNRIILFTARGSTTGIDWSKATEEQMRKWGVKYHQLKFGKPAATFYVDDKNLSLSELFLLAEQWGIISQKRCRDETDIYGSRSGKWRTF